MSDAKKIHHVFILMGVSGSGKSAVATGIAQKIGAAFLDGDFLHPRANIKKMAAGHALNDSDRLPWLKALSDAIFAMQRMNNISLIACSALKKKYRDILRNSNQHLSFLYLEGDFKLIESRFKKRKNYFFKPNMLVSQFDTLEVPNNDEKDVYVIDIKLPLIEVIDNTVKLINEIITKENK
ncbi:MAG: gluconokinase [Arsenophonus endosymbiont of Dermacentor nuttalli]